MIKVCHLLDTLGIGGLEKNAVNIVLGLEGEKYNQQVWCLREKGPFAQELEAQGILVRPFHFKSGICKGYELLRLANALAKEKFMIIHAHGLYPSIWARVAALLAGVPVRIAHCQNLYYGLILKDRLALRCLSYSTARIIAASRAVKVSLVEALGIDPGKIEVVYNSARDIDTGGLEERQIMRREMGIKEGDFVVGMAGRLEEHKGHYYLLKAVSFLKPVFRQIKCLIIGAGKDRLDLEFRADSLGLRGQVVFTGVRTDVERLYQLMDVFVQPSTLREGLPLVLAEAASSRLALVATDIGGNPEIVRDGFNGFIIKPRDAAAIATKVEYLINHPLQRRAMGDNSRRIWQENFSLKRMIGNIDQLYQNSLCAHRMNKRK